VSWWVGMDRSVFYWRLLEPVVARRRGAADDPFVVVGSEFTDDQGNAMLYPMLCPLVHGF